MMLNERAKARARQRAFRKLAALHDQEFDRLFEGELDRARREQITEGKIRAAVDALDTSDLCEHGFPLPCQKRHDGEVAP